MQAGGTGDVDADFKVGEVWCRASTGYDAGNFHTVTDEVDLRPGFDTSGFFRNQQVTGRGSQFDQCQIETAGTNDTVDDHIIDTGDVDFATIDCPDGTGAECADALGPGGGGGTGRNEDVATGFQAAAQFN